MNSFQKIRLTALASTAISVAFLSSGCTHSVTPEQSSYVPPTTITDWTQSGFANPNNPYDTIGLQHNEALNYVAARLSSVINDDTLYPGTDTLAILFNDSIRGYWSGVGNDDSLSAHLQCARFGATHIDSLVNPAVMSPAFYAEWAQLDTILDTGTTADGMISSIIDFENAASANKKLTQSELAATLAAGAVARYSVSYWTSSDTSQWASFRPHQRAIVYGCLAGKRNFVIPLGLFGNYPWWDRDATGFVGGALISLAGGPEFAVGVGLITGVLRSM